MELKTEIKKELKDGFNRCEQENNILPSFAWLAGTLLWMMTVIFVALSVLILIGWEPRLELAFSDLRFTQSITQRFS